MKRPKDIIKIPRCPDCGHGPLERRRVRHTWHEGVGEKREYAADLDVVACPSCGCEVIDEYARRQQHEVWCRENGLLGPAEIRALRKSLGLSTESFAELLGVGQASISRWERGILVQNVANDRLMRLLTIEAAAAELGRLSGVHLPKVTGGASTRLVRPDGTATEWKRTPSPGFQMDPERLKRRESFERTTFGLRIDAA